MWKSVKQPFTLIRQYLWQGEGQQQVRKAQRGARANLWCLLSQGPFINREAWRFSFSQNPNRIGVPLPGDAPRDQVTISRRWAVFVLGFPREKQLTGHWVPFYPHLAPQSPTGGSLFATSQLWYLQLSQAARPFWSSWAPWNSAVNHLHS